MARRIAGMPRALLARVRRVATPRRLRRFDRLHLGSGARRLDGWANVDINGLGAIVWDLRKPLPVRPGQIRFVYTEHFIEHIGRDDAVRLLRHVRRTLADEGVLRVSTPDLAHLVEEYRARRVVHMEHGGWYPETPCIMLNEAMRLWDHVFLYDEAELRRLLEECGYSRIERVEWGQSEFSELRSLESRPDFSDLIVEARK